MEEQVKGSRYWILDLFRTVLIVNMLVYHTLWDCVYIYQADWKWFHYKWEYVWQQSICWGFILLSGFCFGLSKHPIRNAFKIGLGGFVLTFLTVIFTPNRKVLFGILTFLSAAMVITSGMEKILKKIPFMIGIIGDFFLFLLFRYCKKGYLGIGGEKWIFLPSAWYANEFTAFLGFPPKGFQSVDYFSLFPWIFLFLTGYFGYEIVREKHWIKQHKNEDKKLYTWISEHSFFIYMIHQPIVYGLLRCFF